MSDKIEIKSLNGHPLADTTARDKIAALEAGGGSGGGAGGLPVGFEGEMVVTIRQNWGNYTYTVDKNWQEVYDCIESGGWRTVWRGFAPYDVIGCSADETSDGKLYITFGYLGGVYCVSDKIIVAYMVYRWFEDGRLMSDLVELNVGTFREDSDNFSPAT